MLDWNRVNEWSHTFYTLVHSLNIAHQIHFGNPAFLDESFRIAGGWVVPDCSYESVLKHHESSGSALTFRRDPNKHFNIPDSTNKCNRQVDFSLPISL